MSAPRGYQQVYEGKWIRIHKRGFVDACCGCPLVHRLNFRTVGNTLEMQTFIDKRATAARRRSKSPSTKDKRAR